LSIVLGGMIGSVQNLTRQGGHGYTEEEELVAVVVVFITGG
jgi:hypothetical protein